MTDPLRITPLLRADRDEATNEALDSIGVGDDTMNLFSTLSRHPRLLKRWAPFGGFFLYRGSLPADDREVMILRTSVLTGADYEWGQHVQIGRETGLSDDVMSAIADLPAESAGDPDVDSPLSAHHRLLCLAVDELHHDSVISDGTWARLAEVYDEPRMIELCMLIGHYHLVAFTLRSLGVEREDGVTAIPEVTA